jgi:RND superfamily putative drug exporter
MATLLYRIGRVAFRRAWLVIAAWILILAAVVGGGIALGGHTQESFSIPGTESQNALNRLAAVFPQASGASAQVVYEAPHGASVKDAAYRTAIERMGTDLEHVKGVDSVMTPFSAYAGKAISANGGIAYTTVQFRGQSSDVTQGTLDAVQATAAQARSAGLTVAFGGQVFENSSFGISPTEVVGVVFAGVVLIITFGSLLAAGMPLLIAILGVGITMGAVTALSAFTTVSSASPVLALMLGLAVGIDYSLFIISRHRTQLARGVAPEESAATAVATAGSAVVFAGTTVIIALLGLLVVGIPFLSIMGLAAAFAVLVSICVANTLVPALLGLAGGRLIPKEGSRAWRRAHAGVTTRPTLGLRWVSIVLKKPLVWVISVVVVLGVLAIPAASLNLNLPTGDQDPAGSTTREAYDLLADGFGPGFNGPLIVVVDITQTTDVTGDLSSISHRLANLDDVAYVGQGIPNQSLDTAIIQVVPKSAPDSTATKDLVQSIRSEEPSIDAAYHTPISVTGQTALSVDISNRLTDALIPFALIVVGLSVLLLMMVFRSIFVPLKAAIGFLLSIAAAIGSVVAVFQWGWLSNALGVEPGPILSFLPIIMMALLFGLAMDYEVFLVSGMREEFVHTGDARASIRSGYSNGVRVVTAAALIMFFVFASFFPNGDGTIKGIAFGLAIGILFDAFAVRMTLVPAAMALAGKAAWWFPKWMQRALPNVDIEGDNLRHHIADLAWAREANAAISADALVVGVESNCLGPVTASIPRGSLVFLAGDAPDRRVVAATLAGRLDPVQGRLQVLGYPLPSDRSKVMQRVALADVGTFEGGKNDWSVSEILAERLELDGPWWRPGASTRQIDSWIARIGGVLAGGLSDVSLASLDPVQRATVLAAAALTEGASVVFVDLGDGLPTVEDGRAFILGLSALAPEGTTLVFGSSSFRAACIPPDTGARTRYDLDLDSLDRKAALR